MDAFNKKAEEYKRKGKKFKRKIHTGYDNESGQPLYSEEEIEPEKMPFIVVVIDEMADLMLVARSDIEHLVQSLAQKARAAGIHLIMATQRPSVDVVTGTIKANFPTRIAFQVASKIDSRTILNEMGAEQLLGRGDMLYMSDGGKVVRVHGPFVSDNEVEDVVRFIKNQETPEYIESLTKEENEINSGTQQNDSNDELFNQAVEVIMKDKRVSTSYIQRKLQIGYNRAARIIEEMEDQGIISEPNNQGKREILGK
jgi:S-DNA-T family DNA segregation ATPase FtsK/SpoIIIE